MSETNTNGNIPLEQGASTEARAAIVRDTKRKKERLQMIKNGLRYKVCYLFFFKFKSYLFSPRCLGSLTSFRTLTLSYGFF